jgi:hypothetical protein
MHSEWELMSTDIVLLAKMLAAVCEGYLQDKGRRQRMLNMVQYYQKQAGLLLKAL